MIKQKFQLKGGYGDLIADEAKYAEFVRSLGYEYYSTYTELSKYYQDTSFQLDERKLEFCTSMYIITLEDKKNKNKVLGIRDVVNLDFEVLSKFYFTKIVILGEGVLSSVFGEDREIIFGNDTENDGEINKYFDKIMGQAILLGASDIHIQKTNRYASLWFRIDGIKLDMGTMPIAIAKTLKRRLVTMADQEDSDFESINGVINYEYDKKQQKKVAAGQLKKAYKDLIYELEEFNINPSNIKKSLSQIESNLNIAGDMDIIDESGENIRPEIEKLKNIAPKYRDLS